MKARTLLFSLLLLATLVFAHEEAVLPTEEDFLSRWFQLDEWNAVVYASTVSGFFIFVSLLLKGHVDRNGEKFLFTGIAAPVLMATIYLIAATIYLNFASESQGPVHWHADYEVWVCGEEVTDWATSGVWYDNKVGDPELHTHEDYRMHVEGTLTKLSEASLHSFFEVSGGQYDDSRVIMPLTGNRTRNVPNGDACPNGKPGQWTLYVESGPKLNERSIRIEPLGPDYVIAHEGNVPPGDVLYLVFDSEDNESGIKEGAK